MKIIFFDGVCNLCNNSVNWLIDHDKKNIFHFASLQSDFAKNKLKELDAENDYLDTVVFLNEEKFYTRSDAALHILKHLGGIYSAAIIFFVVPKFIRDFTYNFIAANRYKWFGKRDVCRVPTPDLKVKFIE